VGTLTRSLVVGGAATAVDVAALALLVGGGLAPTTANVPALLVGVTVQFLGNKLWAFRDRSRAYVRQGSLFALVELGTLVLNGAAFHVLVAWLLVPWLLARPLGTLLVYAGFSYPLWARIFRPPPGAPGSGRARTWAGA
jgi:putative flippase GtrA